jgi:predicted nucleic acid-binding protein
VIVVSDTSVISGLVQSGNLYLLHNLYEKIIIPREVYLELEGLGPAFRHELTQAWIETRDVSQVSLLNELTEILDRGEAEAIVLATELHADSLLIDEKRGRAIAARMGIPITGILGILIKAKERNYIPAIKPVLEALLSKGGVWLKPELIAKVLKDNNEY